MSNINRVIYTLLLATALATSLVTWLAPWEDDEATPDYTHNNLFEFCAVQPDDEDCQ